MTAIQNPPFASVEVADAFEAWPEFLRAKALGFREMIFEVANKTHGVGQVHETLKWGMPAYLTKKPKSGTTLRLEARAETGTYGLYVPCSTSLIENCRSLYRDKFRFDKNRGLVFDKDAVVPEAELRHFIAMALTYHLKWVPNTVTQDNDPGSDHSKFAELLPPREAEVVKK